MTWKDIPGYEGLYEASDSGLIRSKEGKTTHSVLHGERKWQQRNLKYTKRYRHPGVDRYDFMVTLWKNKSPHKYLVARLIASTFIDNNLDTKLTVNHIDGNSLNNNVSNLEWLSISDNIKYGFEHGQYSSVCKGIRLMSDTGNVMDFDSFAKCDRFLGKYLGYTSRTLMVGHDILFSKHGDKYYVNERW